MICPYCGSPNIERIGHYLYICYDCGEQFSVSFNRHKSVICKDLTLTFPLEESN